MMINSLQDVKSFLNEIRGNVQIFTNQTANCRNRFYLIILYSIISKLISFFILFLILMFVVGFASISLGNYINTVLDSSFLGYGIISLFYLIIFLFLFQLSKSGTLKKMIEKEMRKGLKS